MGVCYTETQNEAEFLDNSHLATAVRRVNILPSVQVLERAGSCLRFVCLSGVSDHNSLIDFLEVLIISNRRDLQINEEIREREVRVVDADGSQLGIMNIRDALSAAASKELDLVKIAPQAQPPVCRIMDYGKYKFEQQKREKEARKNQKTIEVKEVRMSLNIDVHDFNTKVKNAQKFLKSGDKVKVSVRFRGREMTHTSLGSDLLRRFLDACSEFGSADKAPKMEGRSMMVILSPKTQTQKPNKKK